MTKNALVTGGNGFIGSHLCEYLLEKDYQVINFSKHSYASNENNPNLINVEGDILDTIRFVETIIDNNVDYIFHLAANTHVDKSFQYPTSFLRTNLFGTVSILEALRYVKNTTNQNIRLLYLSTDEVFGEIKEGFAKENDVLAPRNPYSASKAGAEHYIATYHQSFGLNTLIARSMNNFGERQNLEKIVGKIVLNCLNDKEYKLYKGSTNSIRGWIYVKDTASALFRIMLEGKTGEIYHIPAKTYLSVEKLNDKIIKLLKKEHLFKGYRGHRLKDDERYALDWQTAKLITNLGWKPEVSFEEGILKMVAWLNSK